MEAGQGSVFLAPLGPGCPGALGPGEAGGLTGGVVQALMCDMVVLADPLAVTLEVDLRGGEGAAAQFNRLVLHDVGVLWLQEEVGQWLGWRRWVGVGEHLAACIGACGGKEGGFREAAGWEALEHSSLPGAHGTEKGKGEVEGRAAGGDLKAPSETWARSGTPGASVSPSCPGFKRLHFAAAQRYDAT